MNRFKMIHHILLLAVGRGQRPLNIYVLTQIMQDSHDFASAWKKSKNSNVFIFMKHVELRKKGPRSTVAKSFAYLITSLWAGEKDAARAENNKMVALSKIQYDSEWIRSILDLLTARGKRNYNQKTKMRDGRYILNICNEYGWYWKKRRWLNESSTVITNEFCRSSVVYNSFLCLSLRPTSFCLWVWVLSRLIKSLKEPLKYINKN